MLKAYEGGVKERFLKALLAGFFRLDKQIILFILFTRCCCVYSKKKSTTQHLVFKKGKSIYATLK